MPFMQRSAWRQFSFLPGPLVRLMLLAMFGLLAGCQGQVSMDLATDLPSDPNVSQAVAFVRGLEFTTSSGSTKSLEFTTSESLDFIAMATDNGVFRMFTNEQLSQGDYTGVRLLFDSDRSADAFVRLFNGTQFPLSVLQGEYAPLSIKIEKNKNSSDSFTLVLDLRQSLRFDNSNDEFTLTPALRAVATAQMSRINGTLNIGCPGGQSLSAGAVYLYQGRDITPDDIGGSGAQPFATSPVFTPQLGGAFSYSLRYLPAGDYTLAVTCQGNSDDPAVDDNLQFQDAVNVRIGESETITVNLP